MLKEVSKMMCLSCNDVATARVSMQVVHSTRKVTSLSGSTMPLFSGAINRWTSEAARP
jgi:hypothetical protein